VISRFQAGNEEPSGRMAVDRVAAKASRRPSCSATCTGSRPSPSTYFAIVWSTSPAAAGGRADYRAQARGSGSGFRSAGWRCFSSSRHAVGIRRHDSCLERDDSPRSSLPAMPFKTPSVSQRFRSRLRRCEPTTFRTRLRQCYNSYLALAKTLRDAHAAHAPMQRNLTSTPQFVDTLELEH